MCEFLHNRAPKCNWTDPPKPLVSCAFPHMSIANVSFLPRRPTFYFTSPYQKQLFQILSPFEAFLTVPRLILTLSSELLCPVSFLGRLFGICPVSIPVSPLPPCFQAASCLHILLPTHALSQQHLVLCNTLKAVAGSLLSPPVWALPALTGMYSPPPNLVRAIFLQIQHQRHSFRKPFLNPHLPVPDSTLHTFLHGLRVLWSLDCLIS